MNVIAMPRIRAAYARHADAKDALLTWRKITSKAAWKSLVDIKLAYPSADYVGNDRYVFNIMGNRYRLITIVDFNSQRVFVRFFGTHAEYDKLTDASLV